MRGEGRVNRTDCAWVWFPIWGDKIVLKLNCAEFVQLFTQNIIKQKTQQLLNCIFKMSEFYDL